MNRPYQLETVTRACEVLRLFRDERHDLTLAEVTEMSGIEKTAAFRLLHTLEASGFLRRVEGRRYRSNITIRSRRTVRIGYAAQASNTPFSDAVTRGIRGAAAKHEFDLIELDNRYSASSALRNAERLVAERVDLAIEFQTYERLGARIGTKFTDAGIPLIAIDIPHPGATYYGIDNFRVGHLIGQTLVRAARSLWHGEVDEVVLLEESAAGSLPRLRLEGAERTIREALPGTGRTVHLNTRGDFETGQDAVRRHLRNTAAKRTLLASINDPTILGALRAFQEAGRQDLCAAVGVGAVPEAREEIRRTDSRLIGSVAVFPERYGQAIMEIAHDLLQGRNVPPAHYAEHELITAQNINSVYASDFLVGPAILARSQSG